MVTVDVILHFNLFQKTGVSFLATLASALVLLFVVSSNKKLKILSVLSMLFCDWCLLLHLLY
jgi:hypothetical protein